MTTETDKECLPVVVECPNTDTRKAIKELDEGEGTKHKSPESFYRDLGI